MPSCLQLTITILQNITIPGLELLSYQASLLIADFYSITLFRFHFRVFLCILYTSLSDGKFPVRNTRDIRHIYNLYIYP